MHSTASILFSLLGLSASRITRNAGLYRFRKFMYLSARIDVTLKNTT